MKLFHGTNIDFDAIDLSKSHHFKDFGRGFYLTDIKHQAEELASKRFLLGGGTPIVQVYDFDESILSNSLYNILRFEKASVEWAEFVFKNRSRSQHYVHNYDIVTGPIADDGVAYLLDRYEEGSFTLEELAEQLEYKHLNSQFYFGTQRVVELLKRID